MEGAWPEGEGAGLVVGGGAGGGGWESSSAFCRQRGRGQGKGRGQLNGGVVAKGAWPRRGCGCEEAWLSAGRSQLEERLPPSAARGGVAEGRGVVSEGAWSRKGAEQGQDEPALPSALGGGRGQGKGAWSGKGLWRWAWLRPCRGGAKGRAEGGASQRGRSSTGGVAKRRGAWPITMWAWPAAVRAGGHWGCRGGARRVGWSRGGRGHALKGVWPSEGACLGEGAWLG